MFPANYFVCQSVIWLAGEGTGHESWLVGSIFRENKHLRRLLIMHITHEKNSIPFLMTTCIINERFAIDAFIVENFIFLGGTEKNAIWVPVDKISLTVWKLYHKRKVVKDLVNKFERETF